MDDSLNYPLSLLEARLAAMLGEAANFTTISGRLLDILAHETDLVDETRSLPRRTNNMSPRAGGDPEGPEAALDRTPDFPAVAAFTLYIGGGRLAASNTVSAGKAGGVGKMLPETGQIGL
jgi:hypothetical protein